MDRVSLGHHIKHLEERHIDLDKKIKEGYTHYMSDDGLAKMKQEKAHVKRMIEETRSKLMALEVVNNLNEAVLKGN